MAQAHMNWQFWLAIVATRSELMWMPEGHDRDSGRPWHGPRQTDAEAVDQAIAMAERFHRMYLQTLRAMRKLRRHRARVVVRKAGAVNVGGQSLNLVEG